jgi:hypothetical protein
MTPFSYLSFLTSIMLALSITRIFSGLGRLIEARRHIRVYGVHLLWAANVFLFAVLNWWILFRWSNWTTWNFFLFLFLLLSPSVTFLLAVNLFPDTHEEKNFKQYYYGNKRWFFIIAALLPPIDAADTLLKGYAHFRDQGPLYVFILALSFVLCVVASFTDNEKYHWFFAVFFMAYLLMFISTNLLLIV